MSLVMLTVKKLLEHFTKKNCKKQIKQIKKRLQLEMWQGEKAINYLLNSNATVVFLIVRLIKRTV